jgi:hypothetical protein
MNRPSPAPPKDAHKLFPRGRCRAVHTREQYEALTTRRDVFLGSFTKMAAHTLARKTSEPGNGSVQVEETPRNCSPSGKLRNREVTRNWFGSYRDQLKRRC